MTGGRGVVPGANGRGAGRVARAAAATQHRPQSRSAGARVHAAAGPAQLVPDSGVPDQRRLQIPKNSGLQAVSAIGKGESAKGRSMSNPGLRQKVGLC